MNKCALTLPNKYVRSIWERELFLEGWLQLHSLINGEVFACSIKEDTRDIQLIFIKLLPWCSSLYLKPMELCASGDMLLQSAVESGSATVSNHRDNGGQLWSLNKIQVQDWHCCYDLK